MSESLRTETIQVERKQFSFDLQENHLGRFLRITENVKGKRDVIIIPVTGLKDFRKALDVIIAHDMTQKTAAPNPQPPPA
jgi:hypothetical protein